MPLQYVCTTEANQIEKKDQVLKTYRGMYMAWLSFT